MQLYKWNQKQNNEAKREHLTWNELVVRDNLRIHDGQVSCGRQGRYSFV